MAVKRQELRDKEMIEEIGVRRREIWRRVGETE
jgi:hypothetical protein